MLMIALSQTDQNSLPKKVKNVGDTFLNIPPVFVFLFVN